MIDVWNVGTSFSPFHDTFFIEVNSQHIMPHLLESFYEFLFIPIRTGNYSFSHVLFLPPNMEYYPRNYRIHLQFIEWERPFEDHISDSQIAQVFICSCLFYFSSIKCTIEVEVLALSIKMFIFPTQLASIFLSHIMDFIQCQVDLKYIIKTTMCPQIRTSIALLELTKQYDLSCGSDLATIIFLQDPLKT